MKLKILFFFIIVYSNFSLALNIRVIDLETLIENNASLQILISKIENDQLNYINSFNERELELKADLDKINNLKLILDNSQIEIEINKYNLNLEEFNDEINVFNYHYDNQISVFKSKILNKILIILQNYSLENQIDLILDSNNYILANNSINITEYILSELNKVEFDKSFETYK